MGHMTKLITRPKPSGLFRFAPITSPMLTMATDINISIKNASITMSGFRGIFIKRPIIRRYITCTIASVTPPSTFPANTLALETGATSTSFKKSSFLSQIMYIP
ncbi:Uncharacterised protein [uncultured archaeon]|nr:Uncharacterised protein [uncultured archaeon]